MNIQKKHTLALHLGKIEHNSLLILLLLVVLIPFNFLFSQDQFIGLQGSLDYGYRKLSTKESLENQLILERDFYEYPSLGFTLGGNYGFRRKNSVLTFEGKYSVRGYDANDTGEPQNSTFIQPEYQEFYYYRFIDLGISVNHYLNTNKLSPFITYGIMGNYFLTGELRRVDFFSDGTIQESFTSIENQTISKLTFQVLAGIGVEYHHSEQVFFRFAPVFNFSLTPLFNSNIMERLYSGSAMISAIYRIPSKSKER